MLAGLDTHSVLRRNENRIICNFREYINHFPLGLRVYVHVHRACLSKFVSPTGLYSEIIAVHCHISGCCSPCKVHSSADLLSGLKMPETCFGLELIYSFAHLTIIEYLHEKETEYPLILANFVLLIFADF